MARALTSDEAPNHGKESFRRIAHDAVSRLGKMLVLDKSPRHSSDHVFGVLSTHERIGI
jgi:hypothetical protein